MNIWGYIWQIYKVLNILNIYTEPAFRNTHIFHSYLLLTLQNNQSKSLSLILGRPVSLAILVNQNPKYTTKTNYWLNCQAEPKLPKTRQPQKWKTTTKLLTCLRNIIQMHVWIFFRNEKNPPEWKFQKKKSKLFPVL